MKTEVKTILRNTEEIEYLRSFFSLSVKYMNGKNSLKTKNLNFSFLNTKERRLR